MIIAAPAKLGAPYRSLVLRVNGSWEVCAAAAAPPPAIFASAESIKTSGQFAAIRSASRPLMLDYFPAQWERQNAADSLHADLTRLATSPQNLRAKCRP